MLEKKKFLTHYYNMDNFILITRKINYSHQECSHSIFFLHSTEVKSGILYRGFIIIRKHVRFPYGRLNPGCKSTS